jgi:NAD(P)-dependent dehydrogenase (short-subunit alcohol dehydrogenase family)
MTKWTVDRIPDQTGRIVVITGASSGIGEVAARVLAGRGATVVLAVRDAARGAATLARIKARHPAADARVSLLDMASLASIRDFAARSERELPRIDVLLNNAGLMQSKRSVTADGFERMFGTNHLGHFALTGLLVPALLHAQGPRVVTIASVAHRRGRIDFDDLQETRSYRASRGYAQSKLANLMFALELDRRARAAGSRLISVAAHPGVATTGFVAATDIPKPLAILGNAAIGVFGQDSEAGALPGLYGATMADVEGGQYWGPDGFREIRGSPRLAATSPQALDRGVAERLWHVSEQLTHVTYPPLA